MKSSHFSAALLLAAALVLAPRAFAADAFLKLEGVDGESTDDKHKGEIEVRSFQLASIQDAAANASRSSAGGGKGKVSIHDISFTKPIDKSSPALMKAATSGKHFPTAVLTCRKAGGSQQEYLVIKLTDVLVSSYRTTGGGGGVGGSESFTLNAADATVEYPAQPTPIAAIKAAPVGAAVALAPLTPTITKVTPSAASAPPGHVLTFTVEGSGSCNRSRIDFGDGSPVVEYPMVSGKSQPAPTHAYTKAGTFEVKVYGLGDPMAKLPAPPKASDNVCTGHATTNVAVSSPALVAPALKR
jgi:type VI secretion system secreted protein Hcp